ncbi:MAG: bacteriophage Gp15 family protein [Clostridiales bacterium]|nr:bacteriophage Gp15 family protein [Clostridiales bacterium]
MNLLIDLLPTSVSVGGREYEIHADFRTSVLFSIMVDDPELTQREKLLHALALYYPEIPEDAAEAIRCITAFYACGHTDDGPGKTAANASAPADLIYSFEYDDAYIYAAFLQQYGIDLTQAQLHWWQFKALLEALDEETLFKKILRYRAVRIDARMTKEEQAFYREMKQLYALPKQISQNDRQRLDAIRDALNGDGKVNSIL